jgi:hypothetical protein
MHYALIVPREQADMPPKSDKPRYPVVISLTTLNNGKVVATLISIKPKLAEANHYVSLREV